MSESNKAYDDYINTLKVDRLKQEGVRIQTRLNALVDTDVPTDRIVETVRKQLLDRSRVGYKKYGVNLERRSKYSAVD